MDPDSVIHCLSRKEKLQEAHQLQLFKANQRLLLDWSLKQTGELADKGLPRTRAEADRLAVEHRDRKVRAVGARSGCHGDLLLLVNHS